MKIINLKDLLDLPEGTVYSQYQPYYFDNIAIKGPNYGRVDFSCTDIFPPPIECNGTGDMMKILDVAENSKLDFSLDFGSGGSNGCFNEEQLYAVWSKEDIQRLIKRLNECL